MMGISEQAKLLEDDGSGAPVSLVDRVMAEVTPTHPGPRPLRRIDAAERG